MARGMYMKQVGCGYTCRFLTLYYCVVLGNCNDKRAHCWRRTNEKLRKGGPIRNGQVSVQAALDFIFQSQ